MGTATSQNPLREFNSILDGKQLDLEALLKKDIVWKRNLVYDLSLNQLNKFVKLRHEFHTNDYPPLEENHNKLFVELQSLLQALA